MVGHVYLAVLLADVLVLNRERAHGLLPADDDLSIGEIEVGKVGV